MEYECRFEHRKYIKKMAITLAFPMGKQLIEMKYGGYRNLCFCSHRIGNLISTYNTGIFVTIFVNRKYHFQ